MQHELFGDVVLMQRSARKRWQASVGIPLIHDHSYQGKPRHVPDNLREDAAYP